MVGVKITKHRVREAETSGASGEDTSNILRKRLNVEKVGLMAEH